MALQRLLLYWRGGVRTWALCRKGSLGEATKQERPALSCSILSVLSTYIPTLKQSWPDHASHSNYTLQLHSTRPRWTLDDLLVGVLGLRTFGMLGTDNGMPGKILEIKGTFHCYSHDRFLSRPFLQSLFHCSQNYLSQIVNFINRLATKSSPYKSHLLPFTLYLYDAYQWYNVNRARRNGRVYHCLLIIYIS